MGIGVKVNSPVYVTTRYDLGRFGAGGRFLSRSGLVVLESALLYKGSLLLYERGLIRYNQNDQLLVNLVTSPSKMYDRAIPFASLGSACFRALSS